MKIIIQAPKDFPDTEWNENFLLGMVNRMLTSYFKYGKVADAYPKKVDAIATLNQKLFDYEVTGNIELLIDIANYAMIEFMHPKHEKAHFRATDSSESSGRTWNTGEVSQSSNDNREAKLRREGD